MIKVTVDRLLLLVISTGAMILDLHQMRIKNSWILFAFASGIIWKFIEYGLKGLGGYVIGAIVPLAVLGWMFIFKMLGAGDIKLFCVLGGIMGPRNILLCIWASFIVGAIISAAIFVSCGGFAERFQYFVLYIKEFLYTRTVKPYCKSKDEWQNIHFAVPVFMSVLLYVGGIY